MALEAILDIERSFWNSSGDQDFYRAHVADEGRFVLSMGVMTKSEVVSAMADAEPWQSFQIENPVEVPIDDDVVGLTYEATGRRATGSDEYSASILSVYRRRGGEWELILHQQTPLES